MIKALIFDFDGLIIDTESAIYQSYQEMYAAHGCRLSLERWAQSIGTTDSDYNPYSDLEALLGCALDREVLGKKQRQREAELIEDLPVLPGVVEYLEDARRLGLKAGVASSSSCRWISEHLSHLGLLPYFDCLKGREDVPKSKPSPALFQEVLDDFELKPSEAVVFEDSQNGILAAKRAGIFVVWVPNPLTRLLPMDSADLRLESLTDMPLEALLSRVEAIQGNTPA
jgi:HAD superfamily hydrolase (TIGR01509 family)